MRHYHGTPLGGTRESVARFAARGTRHFLVPFGRDEDLPIVSQECAGFCLDNGAFTAWQRGEPISNWTPYYEWVQAWSKHPRFDFAIIPDVIDGDEAANDTLLRDWERRFSDPSVEGVPVWHLHESLERLDRIVTSHWRRVAFGSSGQWASPGSESWWVRMHEAMSVACDSQGRPRRKLHGLRMLAPPLVERLPFASADSTNVAQNANLMPRFGQYKPPTRDQRAEVIAARIESVKSPPVWIPAQSQGVFDWFDPKTAASDSLQQP